MTGETGHISLRVVTGLDYESAGLPVGAVAHLRLEESMSGPVARAVARQSLPVPVGEKIPPRLLELPAGFWSLGVEMPSGEILQQEFDLPAGHHIPLDIVADRSGHETLAWHFMSGSVAGSDRFRHPLRAATAETERKIAQEVEETGKYDFEVRRDGLVARIQSEFLDEHPELRSVRELLASPEFEVGNERFDALEQAISVLADETPPEFARLDILPPPPDGIWNHLLREIESGAAQPSLWKAEAPIRSLYTALRVGAAAWNIHMPYAHVVAEAFGERRLVSIPDEWMKLSGEPAEIEILFRFLRNEGNLTEVTIKDEATLAMLSYLRRDRLQEAAMFANDFKEWLFHKHTNPFAAAAGGYVLLATRLNSGDTVWHQWIGNLNNWFEWLPDGAVLEGAMRLNGPPEDRDLERAAQCFREAFDRGVPVYSLGLAWLKSGLDTLEGQFGFLREPAEVVRQVARMVETRQTLTTLRLPPLQQ